MKEDFLHHIWKYKLFNTVNLKTVRDESIQLLNSGLHNLNSGPDFFNAKLRIDNQLWAGNVEIHIKSSDWYIHGHEKDKNYDTIILHVVWEHDAEVYRKDNSLIPVIELKDCVDSSIFANYQLLFSTQQKWINCESEIASVDEFEISNCLERLYIERLEQKSIPIQQLLTVSKNDWEAVLFKMLAKSFGLKVNAEAFLNLANAIDFAILRKERAQLKRVEALLFGQAGMLNNTVQDAYFQSLQQEYVYLQQKYKINPLPESQFQFFRLRPNNFPTIRIAQLAFLFHKKEHLFLQTIEINTKEEFYSLFDVSVSDYWKTHYSFTSISKKSSKKLSKSFIDLLLINTIVPLKFLYLKSINRLDEEGLLDALKQIKPEKNTIITKFKALGVSSENAFESQALLQLKNEYCTKQRCLACAIGNVILKK